MQPLTNQLVNWYRKNRILYPWRRTKDPYRVWLSEILLQQTRIPVVLQYYEQILERFPTLTDLAVSDDAAFLATWSGIGYYRRAYNMLQCARKLVRDYDGQFPEDREKLLQLPGIGPYTAGAIRNVCFGQLTPSIDGNIRRVLCRITGTETRLEAAFLKFGQDVSSADYFQALMELGEQICLPTPKCFLCPIRNFCNAFRKGSVDRLPRKPPKKRPVLYHWYFVLLEHNGSAYYVRNRKRAFLKEAWIFPDLLSSMELDEHEIKLEIEKEWNLQLSKLLHIGTVQHAVTFRKIHAYVLSAKRWRMRNGSGKWLSPEQLKQHPTSSITSKVLKEISAGFSRR